MPKAAFIFLAASTILGSVRWASLRGHPQAPRVDARASGSAATGQLDIASISALVPSRRPPALRTSPHDPGRVVSNPSLCVFLSGETFRDGRKNRGQAGNLEDGWIVTEQTRAVESQREFLFAPLARALNASVVDLFLDTNLGPAASAAKLHSQLRELYRPYQFRKAIFRHWDRDWSSLLNTTTGNFLRNGSRPEMRHVWEVARGAGGEKLETETLLIPAHPGFADVSRFVEEYRSDAYAFPTAGGPTAAAWDRDRIEYALGNGVLPYYYDPTRAWLRDFAGEADCSCGLLVVRPDLVFRDGMKKALETAVLSVAAMLPGVIMGREGSDAVSPGAAGAPPTTRPEKLSGLDSAPFPQRWSFAAKKSVPLDLSKVLFLAADGPFIHESELNAGRLRVMDTWTWFPGWAVRQWGHFEEDDVLTPENSPRTPASGTPADRTGAPAVSLPPTLAQRIARSCPPSSSSTHGSSASGEDSACDDSFLPRARLLRNHHAFAYFRTPTTEADKNWLRENVAFVCFNALYDANSSGTWNPFYRIAARLPVKGYNPNRDAPTAEVEAQVADVAVGM